MWHHDVQAYEFEDLSLEYAFYAQCLGETFRRIMREECANGNRAAPLPEQIRLRCRIEILILLDRS